MYLSNKKRNEILRKTYGHCAYCGSYLNEVTFDHVRARSENGKMDSDNLLPCCPSCNVMKGSMTLEQFREFVYKQSSQFNRESWHWKSVCEVRFFFERLDKKKIEKILEET